MLLRVAQKCPSLHRFRHKPLSSCASDLLPNWQSLHHHQHDHDSQRRQQQQLRSFKRTACSPLFQQQTTLTEEFLTDAAFYGALCRNLDVSIEDVSKKGRGRGLVARDRGFSAGQVVFVEKPFAAACDTCVGGKMDCKLCTDPIELGDLVVRGEGAIRPDSTTTPTQATASMAKPMTIEEILGGPQRKIDVEIYCTREAKKTISPTDGKEHYAVMSGSKNVDLQQQGAAQVFPVMVKKLTAKVLYDFLKCGNVFDSWFILAHLTYPKVLGSAPPEWKEQYELFLTDLWSKSQDRDVNKQFFDLNLFYSRMMGMLHLNTFMLDTEPHVNVVNKPDPNDGHARLFVNMPSIPLPKVRKNVVLLYILASFINHSCAPNVTPVCDDSNFRTYFVATRDIAPGEEITVAYCDVINMSMKERREHLEWAYGFRCYDEKCLDCQKEDEEAQKQQVSSSQQSAQQQ